MDQHLFEPENGDDMPDQLTDTDRTAVVHALAEEMAELFHEFVDGRIPFEELTFEMFDTLQTLYAIRSGDISVELEFDDEDEDAGPPAGPGNGRKEPSDDRV